MGIQAGVGLSHHRNPRFAGEEAANQAIEAVGVDEPDFTLVFATVGYNQQHLIEAVRKATHGAALCGCSADSFDVYCHK